MIGHWVRATSRRLSSSVQVRWLWWRRSRQCEVQRRNAKAPYGNNLHLQEKAFRLLPRLANVSWHSYHFHWQFQRGLTGFLGATKGNRSSTAEGGEQVCLFDSWRDWRLLRIKGNSMEPTLTSGQLVQSRPYRRTSFCEGLRGKIVAFRHPLNPGAIYIKRVTGLPGEHVAIVRGVVEIEGQPLEETYVPGPIETPASGATQWVNNSDEVFVLGDNRADSEDSRRFGPVPLSLIVGQVSFRWWPPGLLK
ncbi:MAG: signal peptidase I [Chloroflexi bacterium]|nr:signal peptidase I [Chloroflexota bacterium]